MKTTKFTCVGALRAQSSNKLLALPCICLIFWAVLAFVSPAALAQANVQGQWVTLNTQMPINPVHIALMHNGKVLVVSGSGNLPSDTTYLAAVWDPTTDTVATQPLPFDMFCNGMVVLPDGRPFVMSGTLQYDPFQGDPRTAAYDPSTGNFVQLQSMAHGRWYPTATTLSDGSVMVFSGLDENSATNTTVEIYKVGSGWSQPFGAGWTPPLYPRMHLLPNGNVFYSGSTTSSAIFNPVTQKWTTGVANTNFSGTRTYGTSVLLPLTPANNYDPRVMIMGGGNPATNTTEIIDLGASNPKWVNGPPMSQPRIEMDAVILPNGKVLAVNGSPNDEVGASLNADLYDPIANTFSSAGANAYARLYHSGALLLPDATVLVIGGNPARGTYEPRLEIYSPAYLFNSDGSLATRPTITSVTPGVIGYGGSFQIQTPNAANISSAVLVRPGSPTHAFDMDQRLVGLSFTAGNGVLNATAPPNGSIAPPGYYLLFILNSAGVPSLAGFVQLSIAPTDQPPTGVITSPASDVAIPAGQAVSFSGTGSDSDGTVTGYSWNFPGGTPSSSASTNPVSVVYSNPGTYVASLTVTDNAGLSDPSPPTRVITVVPSYSLSASPATQTVNLGGSTSYTVTVTPVTGFTGTVSFSASGLPSGATATFNPTTVSTSGSTTMTVVTGSAPAGIYPLTITGTSGGFTQTTSATLALGVVTTPVITPGTGTYLNSVLVSITDATNGATIYYTADGSVPTVTPSEQYTGSFTLTVSATVHAIAVASGFANSDVATANYTVQTGPSGLVAWWKFDDGSGTTAIDSSGNGNTLSLVNGVSWVAGKIGGAISANGTNQYATEPGINLNATNTVTVAFWANRTYSTTVESVMLESSTNYNFSTTGFGFFPDDTQCHGIQAAVHGNAGYSTNCYTQPSSGVWHHLAIIYDKTQAGNAQTALYVDGVLQTPTSNLNNTAQNSNSFGTNPIYLFSRAGSQFLNAGQLDDLRIYNRALSANEIQQLFQAGSASLVSIAVTPANPSIAKGASQQFTATGTYSDSSKQNLTGSVTWSSTNTAVGMIGSDAGLATGVDTGSTTISAASGAISGSTNLTVTEPALISITSANSVSFLVGTAGSFTVTATGSPTPSLMETGALPSPVTFKNNGNGTATLSGTPAAGTAGSYPIAITASNGVGMAATQSFTLIVNSGPDFSIVANPASITISKPGQPGSTSLMLSAMNGLTGSFNLVPECASLPSESTCSVSPTTVTFSSTIATANIMLTVTTTAPSSVAPNRNFHSPEAGIGIGTPIAISLIALSSLLGLLRTRRKMEFVLAAIVFAALFTLAACAGSSGGGVHDPGTPVGLDPNASISLTLGSATHSIQFSVNVQ